MRRSFFLQMVFVGSVALSALFFTATPAQAGIFDWFFNYNDTQKNSEETVKAVVDGEDGKANKKHFDDGTLQNVQSSAINYILGPSDRSVANLTTEQKRLVYARYGQGGAIGAVTDGIVALYTPPASAQTYVADLLHSAHIIPKAQAQGLGFASLDPILEIWKIFRNLAYLVFVILFIVIGFMIMFRQKIGQTAVTVQQAIPNIIVSLIFVTFSYAIAGFMIDLMYVMMYLLVGMFSSGAKAYEIMQYSFIDVGLAVLSNSGGTGAFKAVMDNVQDIVSVAVNMDGIGEAIGWVAGLTAAVIMAVAILISVFKLFFELLKTYITIVLSIAFAPLILMMGALPGRNAFKTWIVNLAGNLLSFPTVLLAIIVFRMFANAGQTIDAGGFLPPFLIGRGVSGTITTLVGVGIVLIMPELVAEMKKAVGVKGGVFEQLAKAMVTNYKKGEWAGKATLGATAAGVGAGGGALIGAGIGAYKGASGGGTLSERMGRMRRGAASGARTGALIGGVAPFAARAVPGLIRGGVRTIGGQVQDIAIEETVKKGIDKVKERPLRKRQEQSRDTLGAQQTQKAGTPTSTENPVKTDAQDGENTFGN